MAFNDNDVTSLKGSFEGSAFRFPREISVDEITADMDPIALGGIYLGEMHTDGVENEEAADSNPVTVWSGRKLRTTYTNWTDTMTTNLVSVLDPDVSRAIYGDGNVTVNDGTIRVAHGLRQPPVSSLLICAVADDGRRHWFFAPRAQPDINLTQTWNETDLVSLPVAWGLLEDSNAMTHYEFTFGTAS